MKVNQLTLFCNINLGLVRYIELGYDSHVGCSLILQWPWYSLQDALFKGKSFNLGSYKI